MSRIILAAPACLLAALCGGCLERTITITSEPPGALVWLNDAEIGRTPVTTGFMHYGTYDVRLELEGYEPVRTHMDADAPLYEYPPLDLVATALPARISTDIAWHFTLSPGLERSLAPEEFERGLIERARETRNLAGGR